MRKVNTKDMIEDSWSSPKGKFAGAGKEISEALGRKPRSTDLMERHPFDVEIIRIEPGKAGYPYHCTARNGSSTMSSPVPALSGIRTARRPSARATRSSSSRTNRTSLSTTAPRISSSMSSRTIPSANRSIIRTARSGACAPPNAASSAANRWIPTMARSENEAHLFDCRARSRQWH